MLEADFQLTNIVSVGFGVKLKDDRLFSVPIDKGVQKVLIDIFVNAMSQGGKRPAWEAYNVSEDYGPGLRLYSSLNDELMHRFKVLYDAGAFADSEDLSLLVPETDFYFVIFRDGEGRRL